ncbi:diaminopimelate epimerase [Microlunatus ginsengisoli]|uniref:Diaminopimelate epimerase n=1 Tax=Microlunatus ginsengisoli TaxID=363863 RepID=A0ABP7AXP1_9ACTN
MRRWSFAKGHGTENDFVILLDRDGVLDLGEEEVRFLCDRHAGVGGDGVLRVVLASHVDGGDPHTWFMDYRNADGSIAEMCGNGIRVFARYLLDEGLVSGHELEIATRAGIKPIAVLPDGSVRVGMGEVRLTGEAVEVTVADGRAYDAVGVDVGNPHAVAFVADPAELAALPLWTAPSWTPAEAFPAGVNAEFVAVLGERHVAMRVYERGSGETRSCGTGTVAVAAATHARLGGSSEPAQYRVDVPGGSVEVELGEGQAWLTGPAVIVAHGEVALPGGRRHRTLED